MIMYKNLQLNFNTNYSLINKKKFYLFQCITFYAVIFFHDLLFFFPSASDLFFFFETALFFKREPQLVINFKL